MFGWLRKLFNFWPFNIKAKRKAIEAAWEKEFSQIESIPEAPKNYTNLSHKTISEIKLRELQEIRDKQLQAMRESI